MKRKVLIIISGHLALRPRAQKEALAAAKAGFEVHVHGLWWNRNLAAEDQKIAKEYGVVFKPVVDLRKKSLGSLLFRIRHRVTREILQRLGMAGVQSFGLAGAELLSEAIRLKPDLTMVHSEVGLWIGKKLLDGGAKVGVDFEDWFSKDLSTEDQKKRPVKAMGALERDLMKRACLVFATSNAMALALADDARCPRIPVLIPNSFSSFGSVPEDKERCDSRMGSAVTFYWFSQTIGPHRGLESVGQALLELKGDWELHLRGDLAGYRRWFENSFSPEIRSRIVIHDPVSNNDLPYHTASHDVGLALEVPHCRSRDLTATNKIFEYLRCGLAIIASDTLGQKEVMSECPGAGWLVPANDVESLRACMQNCLDDREQLSRVKNEAYAASKGFWDWRRFEGRIGEEMIAALGIGSDSR